MSNLRATTSMAKNEIRMRKAREVMDGLEFRDYDCAALVNSTSFLLGSGSDLKNA